MKKEAVENGALLIHFSQPLLAGKNIPPKEQTICLGKDEVFHGNIYFYRYFPRHDRGTVFRAGGQTFHTPHF